MWKFVRRLNIRALRQRLSTTTDADERARLMKVIAEEEARLLKDGDKRDSDLPIDR